MSDLHLEMEYWRLKMPRWPAFKAPHPPRGPKLDSVGPVDLVLLAGDIHNGCRGVAYADQVARYLGAPVVMIAGNHELYHHDTATLLPALAGAAASTAGRVRFLENACASLSLQGRRINILGCTLWTDYDLHGDQPAAMRAAQARMNDHVFIASDGLAFTPADALARHLASRRWLREALAAQPAAAINIILTHHAPDGGLLGARGGAIAPAYGSNLLAEFKPRRPAAWIHGHTHYRHDSLIQGIRILSAPRGYAAQDGPDATPFTPGILRID